MTILVNINHETGDLSQYTATYTDSGNLSVASAAALANTVKGMSVNLPGGTTTAKYAEKNITLATNNYRTRYYLDPNTLTITQYCNLNIADALQNSTAYQLFACYLTWDLAPYQIKWGAGKDSGSNTAGNTYTITDSPHIIEINIVRAATNVSSDGTAELIIDGVSKQTITGLDNYDLFPVIDRVRMGACSGVTTGMSGTYYLDELIVNNDGGIIGPYLGAGKAGLAFGEQTVSQGESPVPWPTWDDGAAGAVTVTGDANWGQLTLSVGKEGRSAVYDLGDANPRTYTLTLNRYGSGSGTSTLQIRGKTTSFTIDEGEPPNWATYTVPTLQSWRYIQVREIKSS
jgi:hypothetical protein